MVNILSKLKKANLTGRGGGCFPTAQKWEMVKKAKGTRKFVVCNGSEGEPGIKKDYYVLEKHAKEMVEGMEIAIEYLKAEKGIVYLNPVYYKKFNRKLKKLCKNKKIEIFCKPHTAGYVGGEETSAMNCLEGLRVEPRLRPPFPTTCGYLDCPTLVNNVETFYDVSLIAKGEYEGKRLYTINGDCVWTGVHYLPEDWTIEKVLRETKNYPNFEFFVQVGGDASGDVVNSGQLIRPVGGGASITVYNLKKHDFLKLMQRWANFFAQESCGQCTPCREGTRRLKELLHDEKIDWELVADLLNNLSESSFCGLGCAVPLPFESFVRNVVSHYPEAGIGLPVEERKFICDCLS